MENTKFRNTLIHRLSAGLTTFLAVVLIGTVMQYQNLFAGEKGLVAVLLISGIVLVSIFRVFDVLKINNKPVLFMGLYNTIFMIAQVIVFAPFHLLSLLWIILLIRTRSYLNGFWSYLWLSIFTLSSLFGLIVVKGTPDDFYSVVAEVGIAFLVTIVLQDSESQRAGFYQVKEKEIVESKHLQHRLESMFNNISLAIFGLDKAGAVVVYNHAALDIINQNAELHGVDIDSVIAISNEEGKPLSFSALSTATDKIDRKDVYLHLGHDEKTPINLVVTKFHQSYSVNDGISYVLTMQDITEQKKLNSEQDDFISVVSHELRTPLTIAEGNVSNAILVNNNNKDDGTVDHALKVAHEQIEFLSQIVNNINTLTQSSQDKLEIKLERIYPKNIIEQVAKAYTNSIVEADLKLVCKVEEDVGSIISSKKFIVDIIKNLIENALKYTEKGTITLGAEYHNKLLNFYVSDTGIGIGHSDIKNIFNKFFRVETHEIQEKGGTGLGLYVSTQLAKRINATLKVKSHPGEGATFTLSIPKIGALEQDTSQVSKTQITEFMSDV